MKKIKVLAILSLLSGIIFISIGSLDKTFYYENNLEGIVLKSLILLPSFLAIILGIFAIFLNIPLSLKGKGSLLFSLLALVGIIIGGSEFFITHGAKSLDALRQSNLRQIMQAMEMYFYDKGEYPEIKVDNNGYIKNKSIGVYLDPLPKNPLRYERILNWKLIKSLPYKGFSNSYDRTRYCIYVEMWGGKFFAISSKGSEILNTAPTVLDCW